jgi:hypothetical protein
MSTMTWREHFDAGKPLRVWFKWLLAPYALAVYVWWQMAVHSGHRWSAGLAELSASALALVVVGWLVEERGQLRFFRRLNPRTQSWAFLGDWLGLAPMGFVAAIVIPGLPQDRWFNSGIWSVVWAVAPLIIGVALAHSFRKGEGDAYDVLRYHALSKLLHNGVAFSVLAAMIVYSLPILIYAIMVGDNTAPALALAFMAVWLCGAVLDGVRAGLPDGHWLKLDGRNLHPQADARGRAISPEIQDVPTWNEFKKLDPEAAFGWADVLHVRKLLILAQTAIGIKRPEWTPAHRAESQLPDSYEGSDSQDWVDDPPDRPD